MYILIRYRKYSLEKLIWRNPRHFLIISAWVAFKGIVKQGKNFVDNYGLLSNPEFGQKRRKNYQDRKNEEFPRDPTIWKVMPRYSEGHAKI